MEKCPFCAAEIQDAAVVCKHCNRAIGKAPGHHYKSLQLSSAPAIFFTASPRNLIAIVVLATIAGWFRLGGGLTTFPSDMNKVQRPAVQRPVDDIHKRVLPEVLDQYNITKRNGSLIEICLHAGMVSAAYLRGNDEANYTKWKATEIADCKAAGMEPRKVGP